MFKSFSFAPLELQRNTPDFFGQVQVFRWQSWWAPRYVSGLQDGVWR